MALPLHQEEFMDGVEAAALTAAGVGVFALGLVMPAGAWLLTVAHTPCARTRPLLTLLALGVWGAVWLVLRWRWRGRAQAARRVVVRAAVLVLLGLAAGSPLWGIFWHQVRLP
jgi:hypothetical protein